MKWKMARKTGLEPATFAVTGRRSNQLSYFRISNGRGLEEAPSPVKQDCNSQNFFAVMA